MRSLETDCERPPTGFPASTEPARRLPRTRNGWDRDAWKRLLELEGTWDTNAKAILAAGLMDWAWEQLPRWLRGKPVQDWEEIRSEFIARVLADRFVHLANAKPGCREAYLRRWLANEVA